MKFPDVKPISQQLGAQVEVDLSRSEIPAGMLMELLNEHGVLLFKRQHLSKTELVDATRRNFGNPMVHPNRNAHDAECPEMVVLSNYGPREDQPPDNDDHVVGDQLWHTDLAYVTRPSRATMLYAVEVPPVGGLTGLVDRANAFDALPQALKARIENLHVVHSWKFTQDLWGHNPIFINKDGSRSADLDRYSDLIYPLVYAHPQSGRKVLNVTPQFSAGIVELPESEGRALLHELILHAVQPDFRYWHRYDIGDVLILDNWRMMHAASGTVGRYRRVMWRTSVEGDVEFGRPLTEAERVIAASRTPATADEIAACLASVPAAA